MAYDSKKLLAAFEKPTFITAAGETVEGRPLSHPQYQKMLADLREAGEDQSKSEPVLRQALIEMQLPADEIIALPDPLYWGALRDFFRCCRGEPAPNGSTPGLSATSSTPA